MERASWKNEMDWTQAKHHYLYEKLYLSNNKCVK